VKYDETKLLIPELDQERYAPAAETAAVLRDFWVSQPLFYTIRNGASTTSAMVGPLLK
jgi:hypothetical protein